ncbi:hypothetical protein AYL20_07545 [Acinetobacter venetianus]|nr:hypothetical protein AYL20_07545 [Acinetobacter venetianus]
MFSYVGYVVQIKYKFIEKNIGNPIVLRFLNVNIGRLEGLEFVVQMGLRFSILLKYLTVTSGNARYVAYRHLKAKEGLWMMMLQS